MLKIGEFSKLSRVSVRMLRHYDDIGLLKPVEIDSFTGYRYYEVDQLLTVGRITSLKDMGFNLSDIIKILDIYDDRNALETYLKTRREEVEACDAFHFVDSVYIVAHRAVAVSVFVYEADGFGCAVVAQHHLKECVGHCHLVATDSLAARLFIEHGTADNV